MFSIIDQDMRCGCLALLGYHLLLLDVLRILMVRLTEKKKASHNIFYWMTSSLLYNLYGDYIVGFRKNSIKCT